MSGRWFCRWLCPILIIVLVIVLWRYPWRPAPVPLPGPGAEPDPTGMTGGPAHLVIEHVDAGTWISTNNRFHKLITASQDSSYFWTGLLVQVGSFPNTGYAFDSLALYDAAGDVEFSSRLGDGDSFLWVNVVGEWDDYPKSPVPVFPEEAFWLFPNETLADTCCGQDYSDGPGKVTERCYRGRQIHPDMERVRAVITYWQGPHGFDARSTQHYGPREDKRFEFWFRDDYRVELWKLDDADDADPKNDRFVQVELTGPVTRVVVAATKRYGPSEGKTQEPPWWFP